VCYSVSVTALVTVDNGFSVIAIQFHQQGEKEPFLHGL